MLFSSQFLIFPLIPAFRPTIPDTGLASHNSKSIVCYNHQQLIIANEPTVNQDFELDECQQQLIIANEPTVNFEMDERQQQLIIANQQIVNQDFEMDECQQQLIIANEPTVAKSRFGDG